VTITYFQILWKRRQKLQLEVLDTKEPIGRDQTETYVTSRKVAQLSLIFFVCYFPLLIGYILPFMPIDHGETTFQLTYTFIVASVSPLQGLFNALVYGLTPELLLFIRNKYNRNQYERIQ